MGQMNCEKCNTLKILKPAGVSKKTGRTYSAFYACPDANCWKTKGNVSVTPQTVGNSTNFATHDELAALNERVKALELSNDPDGGEDLPF